MAISTINAASAGATGTVMVSGNMPAFRAYANANQSITANTLTVVTLGATTFDTASCFSTSTYRFTPNVAGYYYFAGHSEWNSSATGSFAAIFKNGSEINRGTDNNTTWLLDASCLVYMNGTTDYVDFRIQGAASQTIDGRSVSTFFYGYLARAA